jgi:beta-lactamase class A
MLDAGVILSRRLSRRMRKMMAPPRIRHKFVAGLQRRQGVRFLARKSGSYRAFHSDSAIIEHGKKRYILVGLSDLANGELVMQRLAQTVDDLLTSGDPQESLVAADGWVSQGGVAASLPQCDVGNRE